MPCRGRRRVRGRLGKRRVGRLQLEAIDFVRRYMNETEAHLFQRRSMTTIHARFLEQRERSIDVRLDELSGEWMERSTCVSAAKCTIARGRWLSSRDATNARFPISPWEQVAAIGFESGEVRGIACVGELVEVDENAILRGDPVPDEVRADESGASGDKDRSFDDRVESCARTIRATWRFVFLGAVLTSGQLVVFEQRLTDHNIASDLDARDIHAREDILARRLVHNLPVVSDIFRRAAGRSRSTGSSRSFDAIPRLHPACGRDTARDAALAAIAWRRANAARDRRLLAEQPREVSLRRDHRHPRAAEERPRYPRRARHALRTGLVELARAARAVLRPHVRRGRRRMRSSAIACSLPARCRIRRGPQDVRDRAPTCEFPWLPSLTPCSCTRPVPPEAVGGALDRARRCARATRLRAGAALGRPQPSAGVASDWRAAIAAPWLSATRAARSVGRALRRAAVRSEWTRASPISLARLACRLSASTPRPNRTHGTVWMRPRCERRRCSARAHGGRSDTGARRRAVSLARAVYTALAGALCLTRVFGCAAGAA